MLLLLCIHVLPTSTVSLSFSMRFSQPRIPGDLDQLINCTGDALLTQDTLDLTRNRLDKNSTSSVGRAKYTHPVPLWDRATGEVASFTTTFSFLITLPDRNSSVTGDGMAFFLAYFESDIPQHSAGGNLGLLPSATNGTGDGSIVAVEFDTFQNLDKADVSSSHVAIDVNSLNSTASTDTTSPTRKLTSRHTMVATVRYENVTKLLAAELRINDDTSYYVNATIDLTSYLPEHVAVGFSAATGDVSELHQILSWSFASTLQDPPSPAPALTPPGPGSSIQQQPNKRSSGGARLVIAVLVPVLSLLACAATAVLLVRHKRRRSTGGRGIGTSDDDDNDDYQQQEELERGVEASGPRRYAYRDLAAATNNFAEDGKLGRGGFGSVYRGTLIDAVGGEERPVAIKMLSSDSSAQGRKEFEAEVRIISRLKHRNLVQLLGWCDSRRHGLLLVYELVAQGSLDRHLHGSSGGGGERFLTWPERYQVILGLGSALRYLHHEWEQCVVHGDIKPSNIMLDGSLGTKLGDFGLARLGDHGAGGRWQTTKAVMGTAGYIDPEFVNTRHPSTHADVYSFGIVLLEVVSGRSPVVLRQGEPPFVLLKWVWSLYGRDAILDAADERLTTMADGRCMEKVLVVGLWCAHPDQTERPSIAQAMHVLQSDDARLPALPPQMYKTVSDLAVTGGGGRAFLDAFSIESYGGGDSSTSTTTMTTTGDSKLSSSSGSSTTALLRDSRDRS